VKNSATKKKIKRPKTTNWARIFIINLCIMFVRKIIASQELTSLIKNDISTNWAKWTDNSNSTELN
jgi:hypothetical protein